jgi:hypothetical protein
MQGMAVVLMDKVMVTATMAIAILQGITFGLPSWYASRKY